ncbi:membrane protein [Polaromonas sp.]|nr:membrane protein [Polaromonas sp.]
MSSPSNPQRRSYWLKTLLEWHWISSGLCLIGLLVFAITGITLNHAADIEAKPAITHLQAVLPTNLLDQLQIQTKLPAAQRTTSAASAPPTPLPLPLDLQTWLDKNWKLKTQSYLVDWSDEEVYLAMPRPGGDAWLRVDLADGAVEYERTQRGWVAYFNDLHKGRHTGEAWSWFIDIFAAACFVFCLTGLVIMKMHAVNRPFTWPVVGFGLLIPLLLALLFIH